LSIVACISIKEIYKVTSHHACITHIPGDQSGSFGSIKMEDRSLRKNPIVEPAYRPGSSGKNAGGFVNLRCKITTSQGFLSDY
jgi:hypothetical protein